MYCKSSRRDTRNIHFDKNCSATAAQQQAAAAAAGVSRRLACSGTHTRQGFTRSEPKAHTKSSLLGLRAPNSWKEIRLSFQGWPVIANAIRTGSAGPAKLKYVRVIDDEDVEEVMVLMWSSRKCAALVKLIFAESRV